MNVRTVLPDRNRIVRHDHRCTHHDTTEHHRGRDDPDGDDRNIAGAEIGALNHHPRPDDCDGGEQRNRDAPVATDEAVGEPTGDRDDGEKRADSDHGPPPEPAREGFVSRSTFAGGSGAHTSAPGGNDTVGISVERVCRQFELASVSDIGSQYGLSQRRKSRPAR